MKRKRFRVWLTVTHSEYMEADNEDEAKSCMRSSHAHLLKGCKEYSLSANEDIPKVGGEQLMTENGPVWTHS